MADNVIEENVISKILVKLKEYYFGSKYDSEKNIIDKTYLKKAEMPLIELAVTGAENVNATITNNVFEVTDRTGTKKTLDLNVSDGTSAGFGEIAATVDNSTGTPNVTVTTSGTNEAKNFTFEFTGLKGEKGDSDKVQDVLVYGESALVDSNKVNITNIGLLRCGTSYVTPYFDDYPIRPIKALVDNSEYMYCNLGDDFPDDEIPYYIYDVQLNKFIELTKNTHQDVDSGDFFSTSEPLDLSHELYLDNDKTGDISDLTKLEIEDSNLFIGLPYVCHDDYLDDDTGDQYIWDATSGKWITVLESWYLIGGDFFSTSEPLDLSHDFLGVSLDEFKLPFKIASADRNYVIAMGYNALAKLYSIAMGYNASANRYSTAMGYQVTSTDTSTAMGYQATSNQSSIAIGYKATSNQSSIAIGYKASAHISSAIAIGETAITNNAGAIAIGTNLPTTKSLYTIGIDKVNVIDMDVDNKGLYLIGLGGYTGTNLVVKEGSVEKLNPNIKSVQDLIKEKVVKETVDFIADATTAEDVVTKFNQLLANLRSAGIMKSELV